MKKVLKVLGCIVALLVLIAVGGYVYYQMQKMHHSENPGAPLTASATGSKLLDDMGRAVDFLARHQELDGDFVAGKLAPHAAFSGLVLDALAALPKEFLDKQTPDYRARLLKMKADCIAYIKSCAQPDGGIYSPIPRFSFGVYSTSVAVVALRDAGVPADDPVMQGAQKYLIASRATVPGLQQGGAGYQPGTRPDLNNTVSMLEALVATGLSKDDPVYKQAEEYVNNCQNRSESNKSGLPVTDDGGFVYLPMPVREGHGVKLPDGRFATPSAGAMSYAGLVSFLYLDVKKDDGRVQSAWKWVNNNYNLTENLGSGAGGLFYYYRIMAKALAKYGEKEVVTADGAKHVWAQDMTLKLQALQRQDGSWVNTAGRFMEDDPVMVTAFCLRILGTCYEQGAR